jgi:phosphoribosyl 1,2-cyclic phosphodiesterase
MLIHNIASSSKGNCTVISDGTHNIIIDCGISCKKVCEAGDYEDFHAMFISHEHTDHVTGAGVMGRKYGMPLYIHENSYNARPEKHWKGCDIHFWEPGEDIEVGELLVHNFSTKHDSMASYGFIISHNNKTLGYLTDTGSFSRLMIEELKSCDAYFLETGHDLDLLMNYEEYDDLLKERISSDWGHLSNAQSMEFLQTLEKQPKFLIFGHLSEKTNSPKIVLDLTKETFPNWDLEQVFVAPESKIFEL